MKVLAIKHVPFESPGYFTNIFEKFNADISILEVYDQKDADFSDNFDVLLILGGPMNIYEEEKFPWLKEEKKWINAAIQNNKIVIGVCLGAQLIADSLGAKISKIDSPEIGWFPIQKINHRIMNFLSDYISVFHWHGEGFSLPEGAEALYKSERTENQAFLYNNRVLGLQFHLEMDKDIIIELCEKCKEDLIQSDSLMKEDEMIRGYEKYSGSNYRMLENIIRWLLKKNNQF